MNALVVEDGQRKHAVEQQVWRWHFIYIILNAADRLSGIYIIKRLAATLCQKKPLKHGHSLWDILNKLIRRQRS